MTLAAPTRRPQAPAKSFATALARFREGRTDEAEALCRRALRAAPDHTGALHLLGVLLSQSGRPDQALAALRRAIALDGMRAELHVDLGNVLLDMDDAEAAQRCFEASLALDGRGVAARVGLGNARLMRGAPAEAASHFRTALGASPDTVAAWSNLGAALRETGDLEGAAAACREAIRRAPDHRDAHLNLGNVALVRRAFHEAEAAFRRALALQPGAPDALVSLGQVLVCQERWTEASACFLEALRRHPDHAGALNGLGTVRLGEWRPEEALLILHRATALRPSDVDARVNLGTAAAHLDHLDASEACFRAALALDPDNPGAHLNLGNLQRRCGRLDDAVASLRRATALDPAQPEVRYNLGLALLARGEWAEGWAEYEWRWRMQRLHDRERFAVPQWSGEPAAGRTLLVHAEQGLGDTVQFCRLATLAAARGLRVVLEVQAPLVRLLRNLAGVEAVIAVGDERPRFDLHCPMLSLPLALGLLPDIVPTAPYLHLDPDDLARWSARLDAAGIGGLRAGLVWGGNAYGEHKGHAAIDRRRSIDPALLAPLFDVPGVAFVSLQKGRGAAPFPAVLDLMDEARDFADTAALIAQLDVVVSVDTSVAHVAGALGKPVLLLDRSDPCWRWPPDRTDSVWYPRHRIHRQAAPGAWGPPVEGVARDLATLTADL